MKNKKNTECSNGLIFAERLLIVPVIGGLFGYVCAMVLTLVPFIRKRPHWLKKKKGRS